MNKFRAFVSRNAICGTRLAPHCFVRRILVIATLTLALLSGAALAADASLEAGGEALQKGDLAAATKIYQQITTARPKSADAEKAWVNLGVIALTGAHWAEGVHCYEQALAINPKDSKALNGKATALLSLGQTDEAGKVWNEALAANPRDIETLSNLGKLAMRLDDYDKAEKLFTAARSADPGNAEPHIGLAEIALVKGNAKTAIVESRAALRLVPDHPAALACLGEALIQNGENSAAVEPLKKSIAQSPLRPEIHLQLAIALYNSGRFADAGLALADAVDLTPDDPRIHLYAGLCYYQLEDPNADTEFDHALKLGVLGHDRAVALYHKGLLRDDAKQLDKAEPLYKDAEKADPKYAPPANNLGLVFQRTDRLMEAAIEFRRALGANPDYDAARLNLGHVLILMGQNQQAKSELEKLRSLPAGTELRERAEEMLAQIKNPVP